MNNLLHSLEAQVNGITSPTDDTSVKFDKIFEKDSLEKLEASGLEEISGLNVVGLIESGSAGKVEVISGFKVELIESGSNRPKKNHPRRRFRSSLPGISEPNRFKALEDFFDEEFETALSRTHSVLNKSSMTRLNSSAFGQYSSARKRRKRGKRDVRGRGNISKIFQQEGNGEINLSQVLKWIEEKISIIRSLSTPEVEKGDIKIFMENLLQEIKTNRPVTCKNENVNVLIGLLENSLREINLRENNCLRIKDLGTILLHLSATAGAQVTTEEVQKYINSDTVLDLYEVLQNQRKLFLETMDSNKKYIGHGIEEMQRTRKDYKEHCETIKDIFSKNAASSDLLEINHKLKSAAEESEKFLREYEESIGYLMTKTKNFFNTKVETDRLVFKFMTREIEHLFKAEVKAHTF